jgi:type 1 glutamine amidotransferase
MLGRCADYQPHEPIAWTNRRPDGGRVFYTALGHPDDFRLPAFTRLLVNGIYWSAGLPVPMVDAKPGAE